MLKYFKSGIVILVLSVSFGLIPIEKNIPNIYPISIENVVKTSSFGMRVHPITKENKMHDGMDFVAKMGTPVISTADGKVISVEYSDTGYGNKIVIEHVSYLKSVYAQLESIKVKEGDVVKQKDVIGTVGSSGTSTGPHLHYEILKDDIRVDPVPYLN